MDKQRLLIVSDTPTLKTGLGRITRELAPRLNQTYDVSVAGWHHMPLLRHSFEFYIYPLSKIAHDQTEQFLTILQDFSPDVLLAVGDIWDFLYIEPLITRYRDEVKPLKAFLWLTVDGEFLAPHWGSILRAFDGVASFSHWGLSELKKYKIENNYKVIYPGVDKEIFFPYPPEYKWKSESIVEVDKTFTCLVVAQNCERKNLPATLEIFAEFQRDKPDVLLFMVTDPREPYGHDLWTIIKRLNIYQKVMIAKYAHPTMGISDAKLNMLYSMATCIVNSSVGEGFALPLLEAQAANCVPMCVNYASAPEIVADRGRIMDVGAMLYGEYGVKRSIISQKSGVKHLNALYDDWKGDKKLIKEYNRKGLEFAGTLTWDKTVTELEEFLSSVELKKQRKWIKEKVKLKDLKLLMVVPSWGKNCGIAEYSKELIAGIEANNEHVSVFPGNDPEMIKSLVKKEGYNCVCLQHEFVFFQDRFVLEKLLDDLKKMDVKTIVEMHSYSPLHNYNDMVMEKADEVVVHCDYFKEQLEKKKKINVNVVPMGCKEHVGFDLTTIRKELNLEGKFPIVGSFGFMRDQKGYHEIAHAVRDLKEEYKDIFFLLVAPKHEFGSSAYEETFYRFIEDMHIEDRTLIIKEYMPEEKLLMTLACADLFILNYKSSPAGGGNSAAVKTLMRVQRPIAVSDTLYFKDLPDSAVYKMKQMSVDNIKDVIREFSEKPVIRKKYVDATNQYLNEHIWNEVAKGHLSVYY